MFLPLVGVVVLILLVGGMLITLVDEKFMTHPIMHKCVDYTPLLSKPVLMATAPCGGCVAISEQGHDIHVANCFLHHT